MRAQTQRRLRHYHNLFGLFFAPAILFFALTGVAQILGLPDDSPGYTAPEWIKPLANIHKHGQLTRAAKPKPASPEPKAKKPADYQPKGRGMTRVFIVLLGLLLATSTALGVWIAFINKAGRQRAALVLAAGTLVPIILLVLTPMRG